MKIILTSKRYFFSIRDTRRGCVGQEEDQSPEITTEYLSQALNSVE